MSAPQVPAPHENATLRLARFVVRNRVGVMAGLVLTTLFFLYPVVNAVFTAYDSPLPGPVVRVDTKARSLFPDHPFIHAQDKYAKEFGGSQLVAIAVVVEDGNIFTPDVIQRVDRITKALDGVGFDSRTEERNARRDELEATGQKTPEQIITLLDREFPRAVLSCMTRAAESLHAITGTPIGSFRNRAEQQLGRLRAELEYSDSKALIAKGLHEYLDELQGKLNGVDDDIFETFFARRPVFRT